MSLLVTGNSLLGCELAETGSRLSLEFSPVAFLSTSCGPAAVQAVLMTDPGLQEAVQRLVHTEGLWPRQVL